MIEIIKAHSSLFTILYLGSHPEDTSEGSTHLTGGADSLPTAGRFAFALNDLKKSNFINENIFPAT
ncbi:MAG: hypothetical protein ACMZ7B_12345 [Balneola sp.]